MEVLVPQLLQTLQMGQIEEGPPVLVSFLPNSLRRVPTSYSGVTLFLRCVRHPILEYLGWSVFLMDAPALLLTGNIQVLVLSLLKCGW